MGLRDIFESKPDRIARMKREMKRAQRKLDLSIEELATKTQKAEAEAVEYAKSGQKSRVAAAVQRIQKLYGTKRGLERRRDIIEGWVIQVDTANTDGELTRVLNGLASLLKVPPSKLPSAIDAFTDRLDERAEEEDIWKEAEAQEAHRSRIGVDDSIPSTEDIMANIMAKAGAEAESEAGKSVKKRKEVEKADVDETADIRQRANKIIEESDK